MNVGESFGAALNMLADRADELTVLPASGFLLSMLVLALILLVQATPSRFRLVRLLFFILTLAAVVSFVIAGVGVATNLPPGTGTAFGVVCLFLGLLVLAKLSQAYRFAALRDARHPSRPEAVTNDLPSQAEFLYSLRDAIRGASLSGMLPLGIRGRWGSGKSYLVDRLLATLAHPPADELPIPCVAVKVSVWEYQGYDDMQWGVLQAIYAHPRTLERLRWLYLPAVAILLSWLRIKFAGLKLKLFDGAVESEATLRLNWQEHLEKVVGRIVGRGWKVVIVLDEIDRATAPTTQAALTLVHRSLNLPGVVVLLPYVQEQVRVKAFDPFVLELADLKDTAYAWFVERDACALNERRDDDDDAEVARQYAKEDPYGELHSLAGHPKPDDRERIFRRFALNWRRTANFQHELYFRAMEQKYLRLHKTIPMLSVADQCAILDLPLLRDGIRRFGEAGRQDMEAWLKRKYDELPGNERLTIRNMIGEWLWLLDLQPRQIDAKEWPDHYYLALVIDRVKQDAQG